MNAININKNKDSLSCLFHKIITFINAANTNKNKSRLEFVNAVNKDTVGINFLFVFFVFFVFFF